NRFPGQVSGYNATGGSGIALSGSGGDLIIGNYLGTDVTGTSALGNSYAGIAIASTNNTVGGTTSAARNLVSGSVYGVAVASNGNLIGGNYIGANAAGTGAVPNSNGILLHAGASSNTIGG